MLQCFKTVRFVLLLALTLNVAVIQHATHASVTYTVTDLGLLGGNSSIVTGINASGQIIGNFRPIDRANPHAFVYPHAFLYSTGVLTDLGNFGGSFGEAFAINDAGQIVGDAGVLNNDPHAFRYSNGTLTDLGTLNFQDVSTALGINAAGTVVGTANTSTANGLYHAFSYANSVMTDLDTLGGDTSQARAINSLGKIVGTADNATGFGNAFSYANGVMTNLGTLGGDFSDAAAINSSGQIVGSSETLFSGTHAFLFSNGTMSDLGTLGGSSSAAMDINTAGQIVGYAHIDPVDHAFINTAGVMTDLNTQIDPNAGWSLQSGDKINTNGLIVGSGTHFNQARSFLLIPNVTISTAPTAAPILAALGVGPTEIDLNWNAIAGATSYDIFRATAAGATHVYRATVSNVTSYRDTGLPASTSYYYIVAAVNSHGAGPKSAEAAGTSLIPVPAAPTNLAATVVSGTEIDLTWNMVATAVSYDVYLNGQYVDEVTSPSDNLTNLISGTTYSFTVLANNAGGSGPFSAPISAMTTPDPAGAITNLTATPIGPSQISLSWDAAASATSYNLYRGTTPGGSHVFIASSPTPNFTNSGLTALTTYYYIVRAANSLGEGPKSSEVSATTFAPGLLPPTNLAATPISGTAIDLTWTASSGATYYNIYQDGEYAGTSSTASFHVTGLTPSTTYTFTVDANNSTGTSAQTSPVSAATNDISVGAISNLSAIPFTPSQVYLSWDSVPSATSYKIYRGTTMGGVHTFIGSSPTSEFFDSGLAASTTYYYVVAASNSLGDGTQSAEVSATTFAPYAPAPTNLAATVISGTEIDLTWTAASGATSYNIYQDGVYVSSTVSLGYAVTGLTQNTTYHFTVASNNDSGTGPQSSSVTATTNSVLPGAVTNLQAAAISSSQIKLTWTAAPFATSYNVFRSASLGTSHTYIGSASTTNFTNSGLSPLTSYYYIVVAVNSTGNGPKSPEVKGTTLTVLPGAISNLQATGVSSSQINLTWTAASYATSYNVFRSASPGASHAYIGQTTGLSFSNTGLSANTSYYYIVVAVNSLGNGPKSPEVKGTTKPATATAIASVSFSPSSITGAGNLTGTLTLNGVAPATNAVVSITSSNPGALFVPATAQISSGLSSRTFTAVSRSVNAPTNVTVTATWGGVSKTTIVTVNPVIATAIASVSFSPSSISGAGNLTGTLTLNGVATASNAVVQLTSSNPSALFVPATAQISSGLSSRTFTAVSRTVATSTNVTVTATWGGVSKTTSVTVNP